MLWSKAYAGLEDRYPRLKWDELGILVDKTTKIPLSSKDSITEVDISSTNNWYNAYLNNNITLSGINGQLKTIENIVKYEGEKNCKSLIWKYPSLVNKDGLYKISPDSANHLYVYCDMTTNGWGWILFGIHGNNNVKYSPIDFFNWVWLPTNTIENYDDKKTWSYNLNDIIEGSFELSTTIQTSDYSQWKKAESSHVWDLTNGIIWLPSADYLTSYSDDYLKSIKPLWLNHKCDINWGWERVLNDIEIDNTSNAKKQFTLTDDIDLQWEFTEDIWHWNIANDFYYRPSYTYCETNSSINPGELNQAVFWVR